MNTHIKLTSSITNVLSKARLTKYQEQSTSKNETELLGLYLWNLALSESLYPSLQMLEIALRNRLYEVISSFYKVGNWLEQHHPLFLKEQERVQEAIKKIRKNGKKISPDRIISELSFGFWTSLFDSRYEHKQLLWPTLLKPVFPYMPARIRTRIYISKILNRIRNLRNRVYHYEPIWHWHDLENQHKDITNTLMWIEPQLNLFNKPIDRFQMVYKTSHTPYESLLSLE